VKRWPPWPSAHTQRDKDHVTPPPRPRLGWVSFRVGRSVGVVARAVTQLVVCCSKANATPVHGAFVCRRPRAAGFFVHRHERVRVVVPDHSHTTVATYAYVNSASQLVDSESERRSGVSNLIGNWDPNEMDKYNLNQIIVIS